jgi:hypothetical protein
MGRVSAAWRTFSTASDRWIAPSLTEAGTCDTVWGINVLKEAQRFPVLADGRSQLIWIAVAQRIA